jgi:hypothetical protein
MPVPHQMNPDLDDMDAPPPCCQPRSQARRFGVRGGFGTAEPMVSATFRDSCRARGPSAGGRLVTALFMPTVLEIFVIRRTGGRPGVCAWGRALPPVTGLVRPACPGMRADRRGHRGCTPGSAVHRKPGKRGQRGPSVAVRETADGAHRPPQLCTPTVVTVHTDRPCSTDARPLCVRGQRNMTIYSATR